MEPDNNQNEAVQHEAEKAPQPTPASTAPVMLDLLKEGWNFFLNRKDLVTWYVVLLVVFSAVTSDLVMSLGNIFTFVAVLAGFVLLIFTFINSWGILYAVSQSDPQSVSYKQAIDWSSKNFFRIMWTNILSGFAALVGFALLIIPGIIITIYLQFSIYALAMGSEYGAPSLKQSYHDVKGRWWTVVGKLFVLGLWLLLIYGVVIFIIGFAVVTSEEDSLTSLVSEALISGVGGVVSVVSMYVLAKYYKHLRAYPVT